LRFFQLTNDYELEKKWGEEGVSCQCFKRKYTNKSLTSFLVLNLYL
jgi:hypothetical protein